MFSEEHVPIALRFFIFDVTIIITELGKSKNTVYS